MLKKWRLFILACFVALSMTGCGEAEVTIVDEDPKENNKETTKKEESKPEFYTVDETVSIDGTEISIHSVSWGKEAEYIESENGKIIRIEVTVKNNSEDHVYVDQIEFALSDADGNMLDAYYGNSDANMFGTEIKKGKQVKGVLEYDVLESESFELFYKPSFSFKSNSEVKWLIQAEDIQ